MGNFDEQIFLNRFSKYFPVVSMSAFNSLAGISLTSADFQLSFWVDLMIPFSLLGLWLSRLYIVIEVQSKSYEAVICITNVINCIVLRER